MRDANKICNESTQSLTWRPKTVLNQVQDDG